MQGVSQEDSERKSLLRLFIVLHIIVLSRSTQLDDFELSSFLCFRIVLLIWGHASFQIHSRA